MAGDYERRLRRVVDHIHDNPAGDLSLDRLADVAALSRFHFHRVYNAVVGETAANTVRRMRLHRAAVGLVQGTDPVAMVARRVGYPNVASFTRAFAGHYGLTPAFRKRDGPDPVRPRRSVLMGIWHPCCPSPARFSRANTRPDTRQRLHENRGLPSCIPVGGDRDRRLGSPHADLSGLTTRGAALAGLCAVS